MFLNFLGIFTLLLGVFGEHQTVINLPGQTISINDPNARVTHGDGGSVSIVGKGFQSYSAPSGSNAPKPQWIDELHIRPESSPPPSFEAFSPSASYPTTVEYQQSEYSSSPPPLTPGVKVVETNYAGEPGRNSVIKTGDHATVIQENYGARRAFFN